MTVSEQIIQVLNDLCEKFGLAIDWTGENIIPYVATLCEKLINYEIWTSAALMIFSITLTIVSIIATNICYPTFKNGWERNKRSYADFGWQLASIIAICGSIGLYIWTLATIYHETIDIIACFTFPELTVLEYLRTMLNSGS